jgi:crotonobetainyl-CoA:carnitine CoA-transferase CaiB-like acyl-CoA transferase
VPQPLSGLLVLDFTTLLPGPLATLMLAEAGARVIKVERPDGETMRTMPPLWEGHGAAFAMLNRGKHGLALDLKNDAGRRELDTLLARADILVEQFRPGVMEALGLGYAAVRQINPRIVYCSISGYGQEGPRAAEAGHDLNYIGATGLLALQPGPPAHPVVPPALIADIGGGSFPAMINILLALRQRDLTGEGCHLDIAMADAMFTFAWHALAIGVATGRYPGAGELPLAGGSPRYALYPTNDGRLIACGALEQKFWDAFCRAIGLAPALAEDRADPAATRAAVAAIIAARSADEWRPLFARADCCATVVASLEDALRDPHFVARGLFDHRVAAGSGATISALPLPLAPAFREPADAKRAPALKRPAD